MKNKKILLIAFLFLFINFLCLSVEIIWLGGWTENFPFRWIQGGFSDGVDFYYTDSQGRRRIASNYSILLNNSLLVNDITDPIIAKGAKINNILDIYTDATNDSLIKQGIDINTQINAKQIKNSPKIFVGHSQGGLKAFSYMDGHDKNNVKAIISVGTPWKGAHVVKNKEAIKKYRNEVLEIYDDIDRYYNRVKNFFIIKTFGQGLPVTRKEVEDEFTGGIWDLLLPSSKNNNKPPIELDSAQSMHPRGNYILDKVQNTKYYDFATYDYTAMKNFTTEYFISKYGYTQPFFENQQFISNCTNAQLVEYFKKNNFELILQFDEKEVWNGKKSIPSNVKIGSIIGIHNDIWTGTAQSKKAGIYERKYIGTTTHYNQYGPYEVANYSSTGFVAQLNKADSDLDMAIMATGLSVFSAWQIEDLRKLQLKVKKMRNHIKLNNIQKRVNTWINSDDHDGLIATFSQQMTPNLGGTWINKTADYSNVRIDVYHAAMDINDDRTKEEPQNLAVRKQIREWIKVLEGVN